MRLSSQRVISYIKPTARFYLFTKLPINRRIVSTRQQHILRAVHCRHAARDRAASHDLVLPMGASDPRQPSPALLPAMSLMALPESTDRPQPSLDHRGFARYTESDLPGNEREVHSLRCYAGWYNRHIVKVH